MIHRALLIAALLGAASVPGLIGAASVPGLIGAASAAPSYLWDAAAPAISVRAGVGGAARPGRWLPVEVTVNAGEARLKGTLSVEWGSAVSRRDLDLAPSSTERITLLVRTIAASPGVHVSIAGIDGTILTASDTPLTLIPADTADVIRVCVGDTSASTSCTVSIPETEAPATARAFDLADEVAWTSRSAALPGESARALALWQAIRWWQDSGSVDPVAAPFDSESRLADRTSLSLVLFVVALCLATTLASWRRAPAFLLAGIPVAISAAGVALVTKSSRDVDMQSSSFVHQFSGVPQSMVRMKGEVEHPGGDTVTLTPAMKDVSLDVLYGLQNSESIITADGQPIYRRTSGRGVRSRFDVNGALDREWLSVTSSGGEMTIANRAPFALRDCELRAENPAAIGTIESGASALASRPVALSPGDTVVCKLPPDWLEWSATAASIRTRGSAFLIFHVWPGPAVAAAESYASR